MRYTILRITFLCAFWSDLVFSSSVKAEIGLEGGIWKFQLPRPAHPSQTPPAIVRLKDEPVTQIVRQIMDRLLSYQNSMATLGIDETKCSACKAKYMQVINDTLNWAKIQKEVKKQLGELVIEVDINKRTAKYYLDTKEITFGQLCNNILDILTSMDYAKVLKRRR